MSEVFDVKLARKELIHNWKKYLLVEIVIVLMMFMVLFLSGLVNGLGRAVSSGIDNIDARAFATDAALILADEPTASLDSERGRHAVEMIQMEAHKRNKAAVMVTHDERVLDLVDKIYRMEDGKLICQSV